MYLLKNIKLLSSKLQNSRRKRPSLHPSLQNKFRILASGQGVKPVRPFDIFNLDSSHFHASKNTSDNR